VDLETVSSQWGDIAAGLVQSLRRLNRQKYDYTAFLKKFAVMGEDMAVNDDEFDPIFYTYGLRMYKRLPLIEPLEYREAKRIREFVIAVDTSGSVAGELVQKFIRKTYHILLSTESFFSRINLHILQCDADIQQDVRITCQENLDQYLKTMTLHGFGGTDFCPVFAHVDQLIRKGEFTNLRGLIYFTDGYGIYPSQKPPYETAFIFLEQEEEPPEVPVWAIRLILPKEDTEDEQQESGK
ncbi:MAG: metallopeptidase, partial [Clostridiales bacterium]|nr:metallopeptidase [Clostridiales bacterium]